MATISVNLNRIINSFSQSIPGVNGPRIGNSLRNFLYENPNLLAQFELFVSTGKLTQINLDKQATGDENLSANVLLKNSGNVLNIGSNFFDSNGEIRNSVKDLFKSTIYHEIFHITQAQNIKDTSLNLKRDLNYLISNYRGSGRINVTEIINNYVKSRLSFEGEAEIYAYNNTYANKWPVGQETLSREEINKIYGGFPTNQRFIVEIPGSNPRQFTRNPLYDYDDNGLLELNDNNKAIFAEQYGGRPRIINGVEVTQFQETAAASIIEMCGTAKGTPLEMNFADANLLRGPNVYTNLAPESYAWRIQI